MGWVYNLQDQNAPTSAPKLIAIALVLTCLATIAVVLRMAIRFKTKKPFALDDAAVIFALIFSISFTSLVILQTRWGQALDPAYFPIQNTLVFAKIQYAEGPIYVLALLGFKIALLASYLRYIGHNGQYRLIVYIVIGSCVATQSIFTCITLFSCRPVAKQWDRSLVGSCINEGASYYAISGVSITQDLIIIILPLPILWNMHLKLKQKVLLSLTFTLGFFVTAISMYRVFLLHELPSYTNSLGITTWTLAEVNLGILIACIPTFAPLIRWVDSKISSATRSNGNQNHHNQRHYKHVPNNNTNAQAPFTIGSGTRAVGARSSSAVIDKSWQYHLNDVLPKRDGNHLSTRSVVAGDTESQENILPPDDKIPVRAPTDISSVMRSPKEGVIGVTG